jgi:hypothetical protein
MITIQDQTTSRAVVLPLTEWFLGAMTTPRAVLTRVGWVDQYDLPTSFFRFVGSETYQLTPGCVRDAFGQTMVVDHHRRLQILEDDRVVLVDETPTQLVCEVGSSVGNSFMNAGNGFSAEAALGRSFLGLGKPSLNLRQRFFFFPKESGVGNLFALIISDEALQPEIEADGPFSRWQRLCLHVSREVDEPLTCGRSTDCGGLDPTLNRPVEVQSEITNLPDLERVPIQDGAAGILGEGKAVVTVTATKAGVAGLAACFDSTEERLESQVQAVLDVLENLGMDVFDPGMLSLPPWKQFVGVVKTQIFLSLFPGAFPGLQRLIVNPSTDTQPTAKNTSLAFLGIQPVFESFNHVPTRV